MLISCRSLGLLVCVIIPALLFSKTNGEKSQASNLSSYTQPERDSSSDGDNVDEEQEPPPDYNDNPHSSSRSSTNSLPQTQAPRRLPEGASSTNSFSQPGLRSQTQGPRPLPEDDTETYTPTTTQSPEQILERRLQILQEEIENFKSEMERKQKDYFLSQSRVIEERQLRLENALTRKADEKINQKRKEAVPKCPKSIQAIDILLDKMKDEIMAISAGLLEQSSASESRQGMRNPSHRNPPVPPPVDPSLTLAHLNKLTPRLYAMEVELFNELSDACSSPLAEKLLDLNEKVKFIRDGEQSRFRQEFVNRALVGINESRYTAVSVELDQFSEAMGVHLNLDVVLQEIISKALILGNGHESLRSVKKILEFLKALNSVNMKAGMRILIAAMKKCPKMVDSVEFLRVAYEAKTAFGTELKTEFPPTFQQLIWGGTQCIRNKLTNQYLVSDRTLISRGRQRGRNETDSGGQGPPQLETPPNQLPLYTAQISKNRKGQVDNKKGKEEYCGWEFYPVLNPEASTFQFIIRQEIKSDWGWNMNVEGMTAFVSPATVNPNFMWQVLSMEQGEVFTMQAMNPDLMANVVNGTTNNFICSTRGRERREVKIQEFGNYCMWILENPFE